MELEVKIKATAKEVFDELLTALQEDIKNSTGENIAIENLVTNYSYKKKLMNYAGSNVEVIVTIANIIYPSVYCATIASSKGVNSVEYSLVDTDGTVSITYKESYIGKSIFQKANNMMMSLIFKNSSKKKMIARFEYLEKQIEAKR